ncbi:MAG: hypothetical protein ABFS02_13710 [Pseudomonadota bacterium]
MNDPDSDIRVECQDAYRKGDLPRRFFLGDRRIEIVEIIDRWLASDHAYIKVRGDDDCVYILHQDVSANRWSLKMYDSGKREEYRLSST